MSNKDTGSLSVTEERCVFVLPVCRWECVCVCVICKQVSLSLCCRISSVFKLFVLFSSFSSSSCWTNFRCKNSCFGFFLYRLSFFVTLRHFKYLRIDCSEAECCSFSIKEHFPAMFSPVDTWADAFYLVSISFDLHGGKQRDKHEGRFRVSSQHLCKLLSNLNRFNNIK